MDPSNIQDSWQLKVPKKAKNNGAEHGQRLGDRGIQPDISKVNTSHENLHKTKRSNASKDRKKNRKPLMPSLRSVSNILSYQVESR